MPGPESGNAKAGDLGERVGALLNEIDAESEPPAGVATAEPPAAPAAGPAAPATPEAKGTEGDKPIESLDAQLAELAEEMIEGDFADEQAVLGGVEKEDAAETPAAPTQRHDTKTPAEPGPPAAPTAPATATVAAPADPGVQAAGAVVAAPDANPGAPAPTTQAASPAPAAQKKSPPRNDAPPTPAGVAGPVKGAAKDSKKQSALGPRAVKVMALVSRPLMNRPPIVRQVVGYLAIGTAFYAVCLWGYLAIRSPAKPEATTGAAALMRSEEEAKKAEKEKAVLAEAADAAKAAARQASKGGHETPAKAEHGEAPAAKPAGGHGGGH